jgi:hypothetical protein
MQTNMLRMSDSADKQMQNRRRNTGGHVKVVKEAVTAEVGYRRGSTRLQLLGRCRGVHPSATAIGGAICPQRPLPLRPGIAIGSFGDEAADCTPIWSSPSLGGHASGNGCAPRSPNAPVAFEYAGHARSASLVCQSSRVVPVALRVALNRTRSKRPSLDTNRLHLL